MEHHTTTRVYNVKDESSVKTGEQKMLYLFAKNCVPQTPFAASCLPRFFSQRPLLLSPSQKLEEEGDKRA
jgi:hypothetical protein